MEEGDVRERSPTEQSSQESDRWRVRIGKKLGRKTTSNVREREEAPNPTPKRDKRDRERQRLKHMLTWDSFLPRAMMRIYFERRRCPEHPTAAELLLFINPSSHPHFSPVSCSSSSLVPFRRRRRPPTAASAGMTMEEIREALVQGEETPPLLLEDPEANSKPRRIALFVEPSPFASVPHPFPFLAC